MPYPWDPPDIANIFSFYTNTWEVYHNQSWRFRVPVRDANGEYYNWGSDPGYKHVFISPTDREGSEIQDAELYGTVDGDIGRDFMPDFINALKPGNYVWEAYLQWEAADGDPILVGRGTLIIKSSIASGHLPP